MKLISAIYFFHLISPAVGLRKKKKKKYTLTYSLPFAVLQTAWEWPWISPGFCSLSSHHNAGRRGMSEIILRKRRKS